MSGNIEDRHIDMYKVKRLMKSLGEASGNSSFMVTLAISPKDRIDRVQDFLNEKYTKAENIKNRRVRMSTQSAITSTLGKLGLYKAIP